jgi:isochorismate hydrolase
VTVESANPAASLLRPERALLLFVDLQEKLMPAIAGGEHVLRNSRLLLHLANVLEVPVVLTTQYRRGLGDIVAEVREVVPSMEAIDKVTFGCFRSDSFLEALDRMPSRDQLVVAGVESHICVCQTVLGALEKSYAAHVVSDAVGARTEANHQVGLARMERAGALVSSAEMVIYELLGRSDGEAFKKMLPYLKG